MKFQYLFFTAITMVLLSGCITPTPLPPLNLSVPDTEQQAELIQAVIGRLKDPDSAKFGQMTLIDDGKGACVEVNAKNTYGGYNGYQQAYLANIKSVGWQVINIYDSTREQCFRFLHNAINGGSGTNDYKTVAKKDVGNSLSGFPVTMECKINLDCIEGKSCRSKKGGGTEFR